MGGQIDVPDFTTVTELASDEVSAEQVERLARRYYWAGDYCQGKDVLEVACGAGQGVGYMATVARTVTAGDCYEPILEMARQHYGKRIEFHLFDAQEMPFPDRSFDVVIIFEAIYYISKLSRFFAECRRVLRPDGYLLIATANKDLYDFNPSPFTHRYLGVSELHSELAQYGFSVACFGDTPVGSVSLHQRVLRPVKALAARLGLIPKSMTAKKLLKRFVFGRLVQMPAEITADTVPHVAPTPLPAGLPDRSHKVIFCAARLEC